MTLDTMASARPLLLGCFIVACQRTMPVTPVSAQEIGRRSVIAFFKDTGRVVTFPDARTFTLQTPAQRDSLRAALKRERTLWRAVSPPDYRFLLRTECFCPGMPGWLLMEVRSGKLLRAWDRTGKPFRLSDGDTFSIDGLFDYLERSADRDAQVRVHFDPRWHFPTYVYSNTPPGPDMWMVIEARGLRPI